MRHQETGAPGRFSFKSKIGFAGMLLVALFSGVPVSWGEESGPFVGYQLGYEMARGDVTGNSAQAGVRLGYAASSPVSYALRFGLGISGTYLLEGGVEYAPYQKGPLRPYLMAGWGVYAIQIDLPRDADPGRVEGNGPHIGIGFDYRTSDRASIGLGVAQRFVRYRPTDSRIRGDLDSTTTLITLRWNVYY
jgi:hypothetical protein